MKASANLLADTGREIHRSATVGRQFVFILEQFKNVVPEIGESNEAERVSIQIWQLRSANDAAGHVKQVESHNRYDLSFKQCWMSTATAHCCCRGIGTTPCSRNLPSAGSMQCSTRF